MSNWQNPFPERTAPPPHIHGQAEPVKSPLNNMRRQQLHDLARAYGISVNPNLTKDQLMPTLVDAEQRGVFRGPVLDQYYFLKAQRDPDRLATPITISPNPSPAPQPSSEEKAEPTAAPNKRKSEKVSNFHTLRKRVREIGLDPREKGMTKKRMEQILAEHSQGAAGSENQGPAGQDGQVGEPRNLESGQAG